MIQFSSSKTKFSFQPLGGLGEIGMNSMLFSFGGEIVALDAGILFADKNDFGISSLHPDFMPCLEKGLLKNWVMTHSHEDHIGAVPALLKLCRKLNVEPPTFWATPFAAAVLRMKLDEERHACVASFKTKIRTVKFKEWIPLSDSLKIQYRKTRHSTLDTAAVAFEWNGSSAEALRFVHSGDFKLDHHEFEDGVVALKDFDFFSEKEPLDFLFLDSTNSNREGQSISEKEIAPAIEKVICKAPKRLYVTMFSSNVYRIATIISLAQKNKKKVCLSGRALNQLHEIAVRDNLYEACPEFDATKIFDRDDISKFPSSEQVVICSGSQGEHRSALNRISYQKHQSFKLEANDWILFSSKVIPGNEKSIYRMVDRLRAAGAKTIFNEDALVEFGGPVHASGHARGSELESFMNFLKPKNLIPVHGTFVHLSTLADLAKKNSFQSNLILNDSLSEYAYENKEWVLKKTEFLDEIPERVLNFDHFSVLSRDPMIQERKKMAGGGAVFVSRKAGQGYLVKSAGLLPEKPLSVDVDSCEEIHEKILEWLFAFGKKMKFSEYDFQKPQTEEVYEQELSRYLKKEIGQRVLVQVFL